MDSSPAPVQQQQRYHGEPHPEGLLFRSTARPFRSSSLNQDSLHGDHNGLLRKVRGSRKNEDTIYGRTVCEWLRLRNPYMRQDRSPCNIILMILFHHHLLYSYITPPLELITGIHLFLVLIGSPLLLMATSVSLYLALDDSCWSGCRSRRYLRSS